MYCTTVFWRQVIYNPISSSPTIASANPIGGYTHVPYRWGSDNMLAIRHTARWRKPTRAFYIWEVTTHVSDPKKSPLAPTSHKIYLQSSYLIRLSPKYSQFIPTLPALAVDYDPLPANHRQRTTKCVPSTWKKVLPSVESHTLRKPTPYVTPSLQQPTPVASYLTRT